MKNGLLLINIGTPRSPSETWQFLREFLSDKRVVTLPAPLRYLLLYGIILPFRSKRTARAYQAIWTEEGSPLLKHSLDLVHKLKHHLKRPDQVVLGMRYGSPSLESALLKLQDCETITVLPLYPQYSSAATGSSIEKVLQLMTKKAVIPSIRVIRDFHAHPSFIHAQAELIKPYLNDSEHILFSYHGVPEQHLHQSGCKQICPIKCPSTLAETNNKACYRAQCFQTTDLIAKTLGLAIEQYTIAFQSRLGRTPWIKPYSDKILVDLYARGIRHITIVCPSFVADCLETLEEIGIRMNEQWLQLGGKKLTLIPCMNDSNAWVSAIIDILSLDRN